VDVKGERQRDGYAEFWRLLLRRPVRSQPWRDFWKVWLVGFGFMAVALALLGQGPFTRTGLAVLVAGAVITYLTGLMFRKLGVIADYRSPER
jgi:hypothetical protein